ncbi:sensor histidine kinase [Hymenobacter cellulosivorans]|uniref:histidine kinase n=1 Tax=Hymenobacter cellulosivorans TaxID=2932249 RepID=A0ABY4FF52_9BACT|nr:HAMP domain-containing sensor histidine kinase [Hymenobacter cellulosivorans]UOQ55313.1 HAMP domain-containing histidine kinase [Hymenobacter cellulosivorans]
MKLQQKLVLLTTLSKALMAVILLLALPWIVETLALRHTDASLRSEQQRVMRRIGQIGITSFLTEPYPNQKVHYDLLQDEFIELRHAVGTQSDTVATLPRQQHGELVDFRVLRHTFALEGQRYTVEIGKSIASVEDVYALLRSLAAYALAFAVLTTLLIELGVINYLLRPVDQIVERLRAVQGPMPAPLPPLPTTTSDFKYLDATIRRMLQKIRLVFEQEREFIANASHELLTPVSILQNRFENMLQAENLPEEAEQQIVTSQRTLHRLTATLRTLLMISRIENEQYARNDQVVVRQVLHDVVAELEDRIADENLTVDWALEGEPTIGAANGSLLFTFFYNLLSNAVKYNHTGGQIRISGQQLAGQPYTVQLFNTGKPIPAEHLPHLFERFRRAGNAHSAEGYGLGLALVRTIAQFHALRLQVASSEQGTTFTIWLPATPLSA